jgi:hypothetical protein
VVFDDLARLLDEARDGTSRPTDDQGNPLPGIVDKATTTCWTPAATS